MTSFGGPISEFFASLGTVAAGGAFLGTTIGLAIGIAARYDRTATIETVALSAAVVGVFAAGVAALEEALT